MNAACFPLYLLAVPNGEWRRARPEDGCLHNETTEDLAKLKKHIPLPRHAVDYIMDTVPIVKRKNEQQYGEYRTKRVILEIRDALQPAIETGIPYQTVLDPLPADPWDCHPPKDRRA